jgi:molybdopterin synthase sulfur carrier subunit
MTARLVWLGQLADVAGVDGQDVWVPASLGWAELLALLSPALAEAVQGDRVRVARNGALLADKSRLEFAPGDEIAFLPPVSGG